MERGPRSALRPLAGEVQSRPSALKRNACGCVRYGSRVDHRATTQRPVDPAGSASELPSVTSDDDSRPTKRWRTWAPSSRAMEKLSTLHVLRVTSPYRPRGTDREDRRHAGARGLNPSRTHTRRHHARSSTPGLYHARVDTPVTIGARHMAENKDVENVDTLKCAFYGAIEGTVLPAGRWVAGSCHQTITIRCGPATACPSGFITTATPAAHAVALLRTGPLPGDRATASGVTSDDDSHEQTSGLRMPQVRATTARRLRVGAGKSAVGPSPARIDHRRYRRWLRLTPRPRG